MHINIVTASDCILALRFAAELGSCVVLNFFLFWNFLGGLCVFCCGFGLFFLRGRFSCFCLVWFYVFVFLGISMYSHNMYFSVF